METKKHKEESFEIGSVHELQSYLEKASQIKVKTFGRRIHFYAPSFMYYKTAYYHSSPTDFPTISVTGGKCALKCKHCGGKVLNTMHPVSDPKELFESCMQLNREGSIGCLISGGCRPDGSVPLNRYADAIARTKRETDLALIVHTGLIDLRTARRLRSAGVDAALIDIIGSDETIREIYRLDSTVKAYEDSLKALQRAGIPFVPHVIVGLHYGRLRGEFHALKMISKYAPSALVIIAFLPIKGTEMQDISPPKPADIARVIVAARLILPRTPLALGCMRPKGKHRIKTDILAIKAGVDAIAFPTDDAIEFARELGYETSFSSLCCSQIFSDICHA